MFKNPSYRPVARGGSLGVKEPPSQIKGPQFYQKGPLFSLKIPQICLKVHYFVEKVHSFVQKNHPVEVSGYGPELHTSYVGHDSMAIIHNARDRDQGNPYNCCYNNES